MNAATPPPKAVFLDRDGTILRHVHYLHRPQDVELVPGAAAALATALRHGARLFLFTNQSGVSRGLFTLADVEAVNTRMIDLLELGPSPFADICIATEPPASETGYRKPSPRFILETLKRFGVSASEAVMIGDNPSDWLAGIRAGIRSVAVRSHLLDEEADRFRVSAGVVLYETLAEWAAHEWRTA